MPGDVGTIEALAAVWPLRLEPARKIYLMALSETLSHERAAELTCLSAQEADDVREYLVDDQRLQRLQGSERVMLSVGSHDRGRLA